MSENAHPVPAAWLTAYYDGELEPARRKQVEAHLATCADCRRELAAMKSLTDWLASDELDSGTVASRDAFWRTLEPRLPDRKPALASTTDSSRLLRWLPGIGLLVLNGSLQAAAVLGAVLMFVLSRALPASAWTAGIERLATSASLGWLAWLWPSEWAGLGLFALFVLVSAALAVCYLAWLAYEWRYGMPAAQRVAA